MKSVYRVGLSDFTHLSRSLANDDNDLDVHARTKRRSHGIDLCNVLWWTRLGCIGKLDCHGHRKLFYLVVGMSEKSPSLCSLRHRLKAAEGRKFIDEVLQYVYFVKYVENTKLETRRYENKHSEVMRVCKWMFAWLAFWTLHFTEWVILGEELYVLESCFLRVYQ